MFYVGQLGTKEDIAQLAPLLTDKAAIGSSSVNWTQIKAEVRDLALAMLLHSRGQALADYGYPYFQIVQGVQPFQTSPGCVGFANDTDREAAFKKWAEFSRRK